MSASKQRDEIAMAKYGMKYAQLPDDGAEQDYVVGVESLERVRAEQLRNAAPELLAALKSAVELIADCQRLGCPAGPIAIPSNIRDALAKAEGR